MFFHISLYTYKLKNLGWFGRILYLYNESSSYNYYTYYFRVIGISHLRVADASVMRNVPSGNTNGPSMMIGEKAADIIKKYRQSANNGGVHTISYYMMILVCIHILMR